MKYLALIFTGSILLCTMNFAFGQITEIGSDVSTYLFDYEKPTVLHCFERPHYAQGQLIPDIGYPPENFDEKMGKFLLEHTVTSNSNEIHLKIALLDKQNKTIPHVGFFLNVTKQGEASFTKLFHTHSGTLDIILNQNYSTSEWSSEGKLEPHQGGLESDNDHFIVNTPMLPKGTYHFNVIGFSAYNDTELFTLTCAPKFDWSLLINEYDSVEILTNSKVNHNSNVLYAPPSKQIKNGIPITDIKCNEGLEFVIKSSDNSPVCVKPETKIKLIERGWGIETYLDKITDIHGTEHSVKYRLDGNVMITDSIYNEDSNSVIITLDAMTSGSLTVEIPRALIDSGHSNCDVNYEREEPFAVLIDHEEALVEEIATTSKKRTLLIPFPENTTEIEIIAFCLI